MSARFPSRIVVLLSLAVAGCSHSTEPGQGSGAVSLTIPKAEFTTPISSAEISALSRLVEKLPGQRIPEFAPAEGSRPLTETMSPDEVISLQRRRFRATLDPSRQARLWRSDPLVARALDEENVQADALAMLVIKLSSGWAAAAIHDQDDPEKCTRLKQDADLRQEELSRLIEQFDESVPQRDPRERQHLVEALAETVALSEFLNLISSVPVETVQVITDHRDRLQMLLPAVATTADFERRLETTAPVVPVHYESK